MKKNLLYRTSLVLLIASHGALADEKGTGYDDGTPDAPPADPASTDTAENPWQELLEWFDVDIQE